MFIGNPRKTERGTSEFIDCLVVRAAPFALNPDLI